MLLDTGLKSRNTGDYRGRAKPGGVLGGRTGKEEREAERREGGRGRTSVLEAFHSCFIFTSLFTLSIRRRERHENSQKGGLRCLDARVEGHIQAGGVCTLSMKNVNSQVRATNGSYKGREKRL